MNSTRTDEQQIRALLANFYAALEAKQAARVISCSTPDTVVYDLPRRCAPTQIRSASWARSTRGSRPSTDPWSTRRATSRSSSAVTSHTATA